MRAVVTLIPRSVCDRKSEVNWACKQDRFAEVAADLESIEASSLTMELNVTIRCLQAKVPVEALCRT